jgi:DNA-binding MurR/RpiR family transcriptional regulator
VPEDEGNAATVSERIHQVMGILAPAERKVARALLAAYPIAGLESITQLAQRAAVSAPTVLRFAAKLGFEGYPDLQRAVQGEVQRQMGSPMSLYGRRPAGEEPHEVLEAARRTFTDALQDTYANQAASAFRSAVDLLADPRLRVHCLGGRFSHSLAYYLYAHLHTMRPGTTLLEPGPLPHRDHVVDLGRRDLLCVFDYRRYQQDTIEWARAAATRGARIVLFTDPGMSPIAEIAAHVLCSSVDAPSPFDSLVAGMALVETVIAALFLALGDRVRGRIGELERVNRGLTIDR